MTSSTSDLSPAPVARRLAALIYDSLLLIALLLVASIPAVVLNQGEAINHNRLYQLYLINIVFFYYAWHWRHGGQTLAMTTWKIRVIANDGGRLSWQQCLLRFIFGLFGLSNLTAYFNKQGLAWHDQISNTVCIRVNTSS